jgi:hypothetical protein
MGRKSRRKREQRKAKEREHTTLDQHKKSGNTLTPPMAALKVRPFAWASDRLPELLWAALLVSRIPRREALIVFGQVAKAGEANDAAIPPFSDIMHSHIAACPEGVRTALLAPLAAHIEVRVALRPLLLFPDLPGYEDWKRTVGLEPEPEEDWDALARAIALTLFHQSQEATDCRWARVLFGIALGRMKFPTSMTRTVDLYLRYPMLDLDGEDIREARACVRATETALWGEPRALPWATAFWSQCLKDTECMESGATQSSIPAAVGTTIEALRDTTTRVRQHCARTRCTTGIDPRHDATFGIALYCLALLRELMGLSVSTGILGRIGLRTLTECLIDIQLLSVKDDLALWTEYRSHGVGQAKLAFLKLDQAEVVPTFASMEVLQELSNEDMWQELVEIKLGFWGNQGPREKAIAAGIKDEYDRLYDWTSAFTHGQWAAVRSVVHRTCGNPLHRLHRIPRNEPRALEDVVPEATRVMARILAAVDRLYPGVDLRLSGTAPTAGGTGDTPT